MYGNMKWQSLSPELAPLKLPAALQQYLLFILFFSFLSCLLHGEMGVRGRSERLK